MTRLVMIVAIAVLSFSAMVAAVGGMTAAEPRGTAAVPSANDIAVNWEWSYDWPAPSAPFDETPITPVESAGAPMFP